MPEEGRYDGISSWRTASVCCSLLHEEVMDALDEKTDDGKEGKNSLYRHRTSAVSVSGHACKGDHESLSGTKGPYLPDPE